jgi:hypothetical protein
MILAIVIYSNSEECKAFVHANWRSGAEIQVNESALTYLTDIRRLRRCQS